MNDNSWETLLKKQQKKFHFAILLLTPVIALAIIIIINNRDFILEKDEKQTETASIDRPRTPTGNDNAIDSPHDSSFSHASDKRLHSDNKNSGLSASPHDKPPVSAPSGELKPAHVKHVSHSADKKNHTPAIAEKPVLHAEVRAEKQSTAQQTEQAVFSIHPEPLKKAPPEKLPPQKPNKHPQESALTHKSITSAPIAKKQPESTESSNPQPLQPKIPLPSKSGHSVSEPAHSPVIEHAAKEAIVKQAADIVFSEELPPITCHLQSRKDVVIKLTLELFFHDEDMRRSLRLQRDKIRLVVQQMIKPKELSEMNVGSLEMQLLENVHRIFDPAMITSVRIKNIQIEKALSE